MDVKIVLFTHFPLNAEFYFSRVNFIVVLQFTFPSLRNFTYFITLISWFSLNLLLKLPPPFFYGNFYILCTAHESNIFFKRTKKKKNIENHALHKLISTKSPHCNFKFRFVLLSVACTKCQFSILMCYKINFMSTNLFNDVSLKTRKYNKCSEFNRKCVGPEIFPLLLHYKKLKKMRS